MNTFKQGIENQKKSVSEIRSRIGGQISLGGLGSPDKGNPPSMSALKQQAQNRTAAADSTSSNSNVNSSSSSSNPPSVESSPVKSGSMIHLTKSRPARSATKPSKDHLTRMRTGSQIAGQVLSDPDQDETEQSPQQQDQEKEGKSNQPLITIPSKKKEEPKEEPKQTTTTTIQEPKSTEPSVQIVKKEEPRVEVENSSSSSSNSSSVPQETKIETAPVVSYKNPLMMVFVSVFILILLKFLFGF